MRFFEILHKELNTQKFMNLFPMWSFCNSSRCARTISHKDRNMHKHTHAQTHTHTNAHSHKHTHILTLTHTHIHTPSCINLNCSQVNFNLLFVFLSFLSSFSLCDVDCLYFSPTFSWKQKTTTCIFFKQNWIQERPYFHKYTNN